ncbi:MAG: DUF4296 domain-containing protein [Bacteroidota bacterium]
MKHLIAFAAFGLLVCFTSCGPPAVNREKEDALPADSVIPEKKMASLLVDVHLLEGGIAILRNKGEQERKWNQEAYRKLFLKYRVNPAQFKRNLEYYEQDPKVFTRIYDTVMVRLNRLRTPAAGKD